MDDNKILNTINTQKSEKSIASIKKTLYLCTCQTKGRAPAFGLTCTFDYVRGAVHVVTCQTKGRAPAFGLTCTFVYVRGAVHVVTCQTKGRAPAFGLTCTFDYVRDAVHVGTKNQVMDVVGTQISQEQKVKS